MATFYIKETDLNPKVQTTLTSPAGAAINLTGATVQFKAKRLGATTLAVDAAATLEDAVNGVVSYTFTGTQTDVFGVYKVNWVVNEDTSTQETYPNEDYDVIYIERAL